MNLLQSVLLGLVQGLTEFLPVSSSGHLVMVRHLTGIDNQTASFVFFDSLLHLGTLLAITLVFREDISKIVSSLINWKADDEENKVYRRIFIYLVIGSVPIAIVGYTFSGLFEELFRSILVVGLMLIVTGLILQAAERFASIERSNSHFSNIRLSDSLWVGFAQVLALFPGLSRSGITIMAGLARGMDRKTAASFSFLFSIPAIIGASAFSFLKIDAAEIVNFPIMIVGIFVAFVSGVAAIKILLYVLEKRRLGLLSIYCFTLGTLMIVLNFI